MEKKIAISRKKAKKLTVSRKKAQILTFYRKRHYPIETLRDGQPVTSRVLMTKRLEFSTSFAHD